jgi:hypothetical protein
MRKKEEKMPYFIELRGCINCDASKDLKKKTGHDYGFDHELMFKCIMLCENYGHSLVRPFIDPVEVIRLAKQDGGGHVIEAAKKYCLDVDKRFGKFYERMGVSLQDILKQEGWL